MPRQEVIFYIDGYNLYRGIKESKILYPFYLWLNISQLCTNLVDKKTEVVKKIRYFSALPIGTSRQDQEKLHRHRTYMGAIKAVDQRVDDALGLMKFIDATCEAVGGCGRNHFLL
jgi:hypothetical protein